MKNYLAKWLTAFEDLSQRERILVLSAAGISVLVFTIFLIVLPTVASLERAQLRVSNAEEQMQLFAALAQQYQTVDASLQQKKQLIEKGPRGQALSKLESLAQSANVRVDAMVPESAGRNDKYVETKVLVTLKSVALADAVNYLSRIETAQDFSIKTLRIQANRNQATQLDVTFTVSAFEPI